MTLNEAFQQFTISAKFKEIAKRKDIPEGVRYRQYLSRYRKGTLSKSTIVDLLEENGYAVSVEFIGVRKQK